MSYKDYLNSKSVPALKEIIRNYMKHVKINVSGKKKSELVAHILSHTDYQNGSIVAKASEIQQANIQEQPAKVKKIKMAKSGTSMVSAKAPSPKKAPSPSKVEKLRSDYAELEKKKAELQYLIALRDKMMQNKKK